MIYVINFTIHECTKTKNEKMKNDTDTWLGFMETSEVRRLRAVTLLMAQHMQTAASEECLKKWEMRYKLATLDDSATYDIQGKIKEFECPDLLGILDLVFYHGKDFKFILQIAINDETKQHEDNTIEVLLNFVESLNKEKVVESELYVWDDTFHFTNSIVTYYNNILSFDFYENGNVHTHDYKNHGSSIYSMIMDRNHVIDVLSDVIDEVNYTYYN